MNLTDRRVMSLLAACGAAAGIGAVSPMAAAQPTVINTSGATLLENFFRARASTIDYIDVDGNGVARGYPNSQVQQLAPFGLPQAFPNNQAWPANVYWAFMNSSVGSTNGYQELIDHGRSYVTQPGTNTNAAVSLRINARTAAIYNRYRFISAGAANDDSGGTNPEVPAGFGSIFNSNNPMGAPIRSTMDGTFRALYTSSAVASTSPNEGLMDMGGLTVDIAPLDVPTTWATRVTTGTANFELNPLQPGYGNNATQPFDKDGRRTANGTRSNTLATLTGGANLSSTPPGVFNPSADANTIFDTSLAFAPVAPVVNFGTGVTRVTISDLRHLFAAGRMPTGENLMVVTRDSGSGTRNAWDNSLGLDPSWGVGDNTGPRNNGVQFDRLGPSYLPSNKQGNNRVEPSVINHRLGIGYVGPERGVEQGWLTGGQMEIADVLNDIYGGTAYVRPTVDAVLDNGPNGFVISGPAVLASFGDPLSAPPEKGGLGWLEPQDGTGFVDINGNGVRDAVEPRPANLNPAMRNVEAAAYLNNINRSIAAFTSLPGSDQSLFTPGEFAATQFVLLGSVDFVKNPVDPIDLIPNPNLNQSLQDFVRTQAGSVYANPAYQAFGNSVAPNTPNSRAGKVPLRSTLAQLGLLQPPITVNPYSDAAVVPDASGYAIDDAALTAPGEATPGRLTYGSNLPLRNLIAGDFNANGVRDVGDIVEMVKAYRERYEGVNWDPPAASGALLALSNTTGQSVAPGLTSIEVIGDFDGDGSFTTGDVRYFADGLLIVSGRLDRAAGFTAVDQAYATLTGNSNFFGTTLATGKAYQAGDSRGDVANAAGRATPGFAPTGGDGGALFYAVGANNTIAKSDIPAAQRNVIDGFDIDYVYQQFKRNPRVADGALDWANLSEAIGGDLSCDMNGDLVVNQADVDVLVGQVLCTTYGDVNLNGIGSYEDFRVACVNLGTAGGWARGDVDGDGTVTAADIDLIKASGRVADFNNDGNIDPDDLSDFIAGYFALPSAPETDLNCDGVIDPDDLSDYLGLFFGVPPPAAACP
ncbi:MAG: hypothetical protein JNK35_11105 [Phycisphaerae bacterium]|nr:hypothetical protein [Phycisphaerae bacterium]